MRAVVVYQSLWGNTAAVARAIAEGIGGEVTVGHTGQVTPEEAAAADLLVVGAPVHALALPTKESLESVAERELGPGEIPAQLDIPLMRDWLGHLPEAHQSAAAFDTRVRGPFGRGGVSGIEKRLKAKGRDVISRGEGFVIINQKSVTEAGSMLREGELARASAWGRDLAQRVGEVSLAR